MEIKLSNNAPPVFEQIKRQDEDGNDFWSARDMAKVLEYAEYRNFLPVIERAKEACQNSEQMVENHFVDFHEMVPIGSGAERKIDSVKLSRYACYLIVQNADPAKEVVALGQTYFAVQTRLQEIRQMEDYNRLSTEDEKLGSTELAANLFRATQTEEKLKREQIKGKQKANQAHYAVGKKVRKTMEEIGGEMPENLPVAGSIKRLVPRPADGGGGKEGKF